MELLRHSQGRIDRRKGTCSDRVITRSVTKKTTKNQVRLHYCSDSNSLARNDKKQSTTRNKDSKLSVCQQPAGQLATEVAHMSSFSQANQPFGSDRAATDRPKQHHADAYDTQQATQHY